MTEVESRFQRERRHFVDICEEMRQRLDESPPDQADIVVLVVVLEYLEFAERMGMPRPPIVGFMEQKPPYWVTGFVWHDPLGDRNGIVLTESQSVKGHWIGCANASDMSPAKPNLIAVLSRWIRMLQKLEEPQFYPALPLIRYENLDHVLGRDPLWRALCSAAEMGEERNQFYRDDLPRWVRKLNCLAAYEWPRRESIIFPQVDSNGLFEGLVLRHCETEKMVRVAFTEACDLDAAGLETVRVHLRNLRDIRAAQILRAANSDEPSNKKIAFSKLTKSTRARDEPAPAGWIYLQEAVAKYGIPCSTLQSWSTGALREKSKTHGSRNERIFEVEALEKLLRDKGRLQE